MTLTSYVEWPPESEAAYRRMDGDGKLRATCEVCGRVKPIGSLFDARICDRCNAARARTAHAQL